MDIGRARLQTVADRQPRVACEIDELQGRKVSISTSMKGVVRTVDLPAPVAPMTLQQFREPPATSQTDHIVLTRWWRPRHRFAWRRYRPLWGRGKEGGFVTGRRVAPEVYNTRFQRGVRTMIQPVWVSNLRHECFMSECTSCTRIPAIRAATRKPRVIHQPASVLRGNSLRGAFRE